MAPAIVAHIGAVLLPPIALGLPLMLTIVGVFGQLSPLLLRATFPPALKLAAVLLIRNIGTGNKILMAVHALAHVSHSSALLHMNVQYALRASQASQQ